MVHMNSMKALESIRSSVSFAFSERLTYAMYIAVSFATYGSIDPLGSYNQCLCMDSKVVVIPSVPSALLTLKALKDWCSMNTWFHIMN